MTSRNGKKFIKKFRLPYRLFTELCTICREHHLFGNDMDATGQSATPIEIKLLGILRTLGIEIVIYCMNIYFLNIYICEIV